MSDIGLRWYELAACKDFTTPTKQPFDLDSGTQAENNVRARWLKRTYCDPCPARQACFDDAVANGATCTVRGGHYFNIKGEHRPADQPTARNVANCGTASGARTHRRYGEPVCGPCRAADTETARTRTRRRDIKHGTSAGYKAHQRRDEPACPDCTRAESRRRSDRHRQQREKEGAA
jgi:hypothetical protein